MSYPELAGGCVECFRSRRASAWLLRCGWSCQLRLLARAVTFAKKWRLEHDADPFVQALRPVRPYLPMHDAATCGLWRSRQLQPRRAPPPHLAERSWRESCAKVHRKMFCAIAARAGDRCAAKPSMQTVAKQKERWAARLFCEMSSNTPTHLPTHALTPSLGKHQRNREPVRYTRQMTTEGKLSYSKRCYSAALRARCAGARSLGQATQA